MTPDIPKIILCQSVRVLQRPMYAAQAGKCFDCGIQIWLAPSSVSLMLTLSDIKTLCEQCSADFISKQEQSPIFALAPGAVQEALAHKMKVENN